MPNANGFPNFQVPQCRGQMTQPPRGPSPQPLYCGPINPDNKPTNMPKSCSSDILSEDPPAWFEDLLNEPETHVNKPHHRRSASDSSANLPMGGWGPVCNFQKLPRFFNGMPQGAPFHRNPSFQPRQGKLWISPSTSTKLPNGLINGKEDGDYQALGMSFSSEPGRMKLARSGTENQGTDASFTSENSSGESNYSKMKLASESNIDAKRKHHNARRSRVRKLQYITELETNAQLLQAAGSEVSAQLEFFEPQNVILGMENRALKQRLESLSHEHYIKSMEHKMLDKELERLKYLYQVQQNMNQHQHQHQHQQRHKQKQNHAIHRRGQSCHDLDTQLGRVNFHPPPRVVATSTSNGTIL